MKNKFMNNKKLLFFFLPSLLGILVFYIIPFLMSFYFAMINNNIEKRFIGLKNFFDLLKDEAFILASKNTFKIIIIIVPLIMIISLILALLLDKLVKHKNLFALLLILPIAVPSGSISFFWKNIFDSNGLINKILFILNISKIDFSKGAYSILTITIIFIWKNIGYNIIVFWSGLNLIPKDLYEFADMEGANEIEKFFYITNPYLHTTSFVVFLLSLINSFQIYKEIYILYGKYPSEDIYMLQHFMNNQFDYLNMQKLTTSAYILVIVISLILVVIFKTQSKLIDRYN